MSAIENLVKRSVEEVLRPLDQMASRCGNLTADHAVRITRGGEGFELPRYLFTGPESGDDALRVGVFAGIHGDRIEGVHALIQFIAQLEQRPEWVRRYRLFVYPICNPSGFVDRTHYARGGKDLNTEFWGGSHEPEVKLLESELVAHAFHGIISLHTDERSDGLYGFVQGRTLTKQLLEPALRAVEQFLPRDEREQIDGLRALRGIVRAESEGTLGAPPKVRPRPFEIQLQAPGSAPSFLREAGLVVALRTILTTYREFIAYAPNL